VEERRLPGPVRADQPDVLAVVEDEADAVQDDRGAIGLREILYLKQERASSVGTGDTGSG
jgi:hypothetical protein